MSVLGHPATEPPSSAATPGTRRHPRSRGDGNRGPPAPAGAASFRVGAASVTHDQSRPNTAEHVGHRGVLTADPAPRNTLVIGRGEVRRQDLTSTGRPTTASTSSVGFPPGAGVPHPPWGIGRHREGDSAPAGSISTRRRSRHGVLAPGDRQAPAPARQDPGPAEGSPETHSWRCGRLRERELLR